MVQFASRMDLLKGSEIRELLKLTAQPDIISFAGGGLPCRFGGERPRGAPVFIH